MSDNPPLTCIHQLVELPERTLITDAPGVFYQKDAGDWWYPGGVNPVTDDDMFEYASGPITVVWRPEA